MYKELAKTLPQYSLIVENVSKEYTDTATVADLREDHPELGFMDEDGLKEILEQAKTMRKREAAKETYLTVDDFYKVYQGNTKDMPLRLFEKIQDAAEDGLCVHDAAVMLWGWLSPDNIKKLSKGHYGPIEEERTYGDRTQNDKGGCRTG